MTRTGKFYALKYISKHELDTSRMVDAILREQKILESVCPHPFLVNLRYAFQDENNVYMVTDLMLGGDLRYYIERAYNSHISISPGRQPQSIFSCFPFIREKKVSQEKEHRIKLTKLRVPELVLVYFMAECCIAIHYLHTKGIVHRDIKPENLLIDSFGFIHLSDLNVAGESKSPFEMISSSKRGI